MATTFKQKAALWRDPMQEQPTKSHYLFEVTIPSPASYWNKTERFEAGALAHSPDEARHIIRNRYPLARQLDLLRVLDPADCDPLQTRADELNEAEDGR